MTSLDIPDRMNKCLLKMTQSLVSQVKMNSEMRCNIYRLQSLHLIHHPQPNTSSLSTGHNNSNAPTPSIQLYQVSSKATSCTALLSSTQQRHVFSQSTICTNPGSTFPHDPQEYTQVPIFLAQFYIPSCLNLFKQVLATAYSHPSHCSILLMLPTFCAFSPCCAQNLVATRE